jgi:hypothetical protein
MAKRFHSEEIKSVNDAALYVVEIHDADFSGSSTVYKVTPSGFNLRTARLGQGIYQPVRATELSLEMYIQNATHFALITDLTNSNEGRFQAKVTKNGNLHYAGNLIIDIGSYEDREYPYLFSIKATDLGGLATTDYSDTDETPYDSYGTLLAHLYRCLEKTGLTTFGWTGSAIMFSTAANWIEDTMSISADRDPYALTRCHHRAFYEIKTGGKYEFMSAFEVLKQVMQVMGCEIVQSEGRWRIKQFTLNLNDTVLWRHYDSTGTYLSNTTDTYTVEIDQTAANGAKLVGGQYTWLAPYKMLNLRYKHRNWVNIIAGATFAGTPFATQEIDSAGGTLSLTCQFNIKRTIVNNTNPTGTPFAERYAITIKVGDRYLLREMYNFNNGNLLYTNASWTTTPSIYEFHFHNNGYFPSLGNALTLNDYITFTTPALASSGTGSVNVQFVSCRVLSTEEVAGVTVNSISGSGSMLIADYTSGPNAVTDTVFSVSNTASSANSVVGDLTSQIGDGTTANSIGKLQIWNEAIPAWQDSDLWKIGGTGTAIAVQNLLLQELMALQKKPVPVMQHTVGYLHDFAPHKRLDDGDSIWVFLGGTFSARMGDWQGEWYRATYSPIDIEILDEYETPSGGGLGGGPVRGGSLDPVSPVGSGPVRGGYTLPPDIPSGPQTPGGGIVPPFDGLILSGISGAQTTTAIAPGSVTSIPVRQNLVANAYQAGQQITIIDPNTGVNQNFIVAANSDEGDTSISVTGYAMAQLSPGAYVVTTGANATQLGIGTASGGGQSSSEWWSIFGTTVSANNDQEHPIEGEDIVLETDANAGDGATSGIRFDGDGLQSFSASSTTPGVKVDKFGGMEINLPVEGEDIVLESDANAGDGATPGIRFDGDGLQSFSASSATPGVKIGKTGKIELANLATGTSSTILVLEGGEVKQKTETPGVTSHAALSGLSADDHTQYLTTARGDARYYTETELDAGQLDNRYFRESEFLGTSAGTGDAAKPIKLNGSGLVDDSMVNFKHTICLVAVVPFTAVNQTINNPFYDAAWLVPTDLNGYYITRVDYALTTNTSTTGSLSVGFRIFNSGNSSISQNNSQVTFNGNDARKSSAPNLQIVSGQWMVPHTGTASAGNLNGTVQGLLLTLYISKF